MQHSPDVPAPERNFTVVAPFVPMGPKATMLKRTVPPTLQTTYDDLDHPDRYHPAALMALEMCPNRPPQQVKRWHIYTDATHQTDSTTDSWALVLTAEDGHGFSFQWPIAALTTDATKRLRPLQNWLH